MRVLPVALLALIACSEKETGDRKQETGTRRQETEETGCTEKPFAESVDVREASGAVWVPASFGLPAHIVIVGDSGTKGAFAVIDAGKGEVVGKGKLEVGEEVRVRRERGREGRAAGKGKPAARRRSVGRHRGAGARRRPLPRAGVERLGAEVPAHRGDRVRAHRRAVRAPPGAGLRRADPQQLQARLRGAVPERPAWRRLRRVRGQPREGGAGLRDDRR